MLLSLEDFALMDASDAQPEGNPLAATELNKKEEGEGIKTASLKELVKV